MKVNDCFSDYIDIISVGAPQGTKLGPILWLFYVNDLKVPNFNAIKYADDTTFYKTISKAETENVAPVIKATQLWSTENNMVLNTDKTVIINIQLHHRHTLDQPIILDSITVNPSTTVKFLGLIFDNRLNFSANVSNIISKTNSTLFLLRHLKSFGMNTNGPKLFYCSNI